MKNWEHIDQPWDVHTKWFSLGEYVLKRQDVEFALRVTRKYLNLDRPYIQNSSLAPEIKFLSPLLKQSFVKPSVVKDSREEMQKKIGKAMETDTNFAFCKKKKTRIPNSSIRQVLAKNLQHIMKSFSSVKIC